MKPLDVSLPSAKIKIFLSCAPYTLLTQYTFNHVQHVQLGEKMKFTKFLAPCSAAVLMMTALATSNANADALTDIAKSGTIRIAVPQDFQPYGSVNSEMQLQGLDIDVS